jgi:hypothetical protein
MFTAVKQRRTAFAKNLVKMRSSSCHDVERSGRLTRFSIPAAGQKEMTTLADEAMPPF